MRQYSVSVVQFILFSFCLCDLGVEKKDSFLNNFIDYLNNIPNQPYVYEEGVLLNAQKLDETTYKIGTKLKVSELHILDAVKFLKCTGSIVDLGEAGITVQNDYHCLELPDENPSEFSRNLEEIVTDNLNSSIEGVVERKPVQLDNEVQPNDALTSGEQFVAIPRERPAPCIGCSTHVSTQAAGVKELAELGVRHLERHEPYVRHTLNTVHDVERQVQVVNGVRYILTLTVDYNNCTDTENESCAFTIPCKISILEKPWLKMPDGSKYRAIVANNCTEEWLFGDSGEVMPPNVNNNRENNEINVNPYNNNPEKADDQPKPTPDYDKIANTGSVDDILKVIHNSDLQAQQNQERILTDDELKKIEEQIIPHNQFNQQSNKNNDRRKEELTKSEIHTEHVEKVETAKHFADNSLTTKKSEENVRTSSLSEDKKNLIDDMMSFFTFSGFETKTTQAEENSRMKRSYEADLQVMSLAEKYQTLKKNVYNAKYLYALGKTLVDYLNEMDMEVKTRTLKDVLAAEEEFDNHMHFFYLQVRVAVPCDKAECDNKDNQKKICNGVIDNSNPKSPQVLNSFCYEELKSTKVGLVKVIPLNDPILHQMIDDAVKKVESESPFINAMSVIKTLNANTQKVSGMLTKISLLLGFLDCNKTIPFDLRKNCSSLQHLGSKICEVEIHTRHQGKQKKITYTCTDRPMDESFMNSKHSDFVGNVNDPKVVEIAQEALQHLDIQSNRNNKQKIVEIKSVSTQIIAGLLTKLEFVVGYTECTNDFTEDINSCKLLEKEQLRQCQAQVWERPWLQDERQVKVSCDDSTNNTQNNEISKLRKKRSPSINFVGGQLQQDAQNSKYQTLAEESLQQYLQNSGTTQHHKVVHVEKVTTQVVSGSLTRIDFKISPTNCQVDSNAQPTSSNCEVISSADIFDCHSKIWEQPWLNKKEITVNCTVDNRKERAKRQIPGGETEQDASDSKYRALAEESLQQYLQNSGITQHHEVVHVQKVITQVVSGSLTKIDFKISPTNCQLDSNGQPTSSDCKVQSSADVFDCHSDIWEQSWLNKKEITVNCTLEKEPTRMKRQVRGGQKEKDASDTKYRILAEESLQQYLQNSGVTQHHEVVRVEKVTTQVVSGSLTRIDFKISPTNCQIDSNGQPTSSDCKVQSSADVIDCHSEIWEQPWLNKKEITVNCTDDTRKSRTKRQIPGGETEQDASDSKYRALAEESLLQYLQNSGITQHHEVVHVQKVITQVVSGSLTKIDFKISPTNCQLDSNGQPTSSDCKVQSSADVFDCHSDIWEQSWLNKKEITVNCTLDQPTRTKQSAMLGEVTEENVDDEKFKALAQESIQKYVLSTESKRVHKLIQLERVRTQIVSGKKTILDFTISPTNCEFDYISKTAQSTCDADLSTVIHCHSEVWERSWLKGEEGKIIDIKCEAMRTLGPIYTVKGKLSSTDISSNDISLLPVENMRNKRNIGVIRRGGTSEQNPSKLLYRQLAEESLRKYMLLEKTDVHHEIVEINRVLTKIVSGTIYNIYYTAARMSCSDNALNKAICTHNSTETLYCHTEIWDRPWMKRKEIEVNCNSDTSDENDNEDKEDRKKRSLNFGGVSEKDVNNDDIKELADQALQKFQRRSKFQYAYKIIKILHADEQVVAGFITNIDFSIALTKCSASESRSNINDCELDSPKVEMNCHATIEDRPIPMVDPDIRVNCRNKRKMKNIAKRDTVVVVKNREKRQTGIDEDYVEEDAKYYYADRAVNEYNQHQTTNNLFKLITIHDTQRSVHMHTLMIRLYIEIAMTYCMRHGEEHELYSCDEIEGLRHKLCLARVWPSPDDEMIVQQVSIVCDDEDNFKTISGISIQELVKASILEIEKSPQIHNKMFHVGETNVVPSLDYRIPIRLSFIAMSSNCTKDFDVEKHPYACIYDEQKVGRVCTSYVYMLPNTRSIHHIEASCRVSQEKRKRRSISLDSRNATADDLIIQEMVQEALEKLEMSSSHRYKQRLLLINSYSTKITTGKQTTIDFDVGYTNCLKYEWVENITSCEFIEHLPRRHCVAQVLERLWTENGRNIEVNCEDDETPLEAHIEFESAENAMHLAKEALKHIEAKYPNPHKQKVVRIFSLEKQTVAGLHYRMKLEVGLTDCIALSMEDNCKLVNTMGLNKFCRVNVWLRPWTDHPPSYRVTCDYQDGATAEIYHQIQSEHLFYNFLTTYKPDYINDPMQMRKRFEIFRTNVRKIHELNIYERGTARYAVTRFADLSEEEFREKYLGLKPGLRDHNQVPMRMADIPKTVELPEKFDWRDFDAVTEVKDQGSCGSCWAFSVTGNIEGQWKMQSGSLVSLSEQELVDCDKLDQGCSGGLPDNAYRAIEELGGLETESDYPYEGEDDKCSYNKTLSRVQISGAVNISSNETDMAKWLVQNGPISIGINANAMQFYMGGVSHPWKMLCSPNNLDHGVLIVGYGVKDYPLFHKRLPYWIVKNSWGKSWGEQGYYRVYRGDGTCGVNQMASSAVI